jgi:hypothetical protein
MCPRLHGRTWMLTPSLRVAVISYHKPTDDSHRNLYDFSYQITKFRGFMDKMRGHVGVDATTYKALQLQLDRHLLQWILTSNQFYNNASLRIM